MEHVARLFIKNEAQDKFEERILDRKKREMEDDVEHR